MTESILNLYTDSTLTEEYRDISFPRVEIGKTHELKFWICNHSEKWNMVVEPVFDIKTESETVEFTSLPDMLKPKEKAEVTIAWTPSTNIDEKLSGWCGLIGRLLIGE